MSLRTAFITLGLCCAWLALNPAWASDAVTRIECYRTGLLKPLHRDRANTMPANIIVWNHYGFGDFYGAGIVNLAVTHPPIGDFYRPSDLGAGRANRQFGPAGHSLVSAFEGYEASPDFINAVVNPSAGRSGSILDFLQLLPLQVMEKIKYLDPDGAKWQAKIASEMDPDQVMFFLATETLQESELLKKYGSLPEAAFRDPQQAAWEHYQSRFVDHAGPSKDPRYVNPVGTSYLASGQVYDKSYPLLMERGLLTPIVGEKYEVGRGAETLRGNFRETFRVAAYYANYRSILLDATRNPETRAVHRADADVSAGVYAKVMNGDRLDHFTSREKGYGFQLYSKYAGKPGEFALRVSLPDFVRGQGIEHMSSSVGHVVAAAGGRLDGLRAQELFLFAKQQATYYLDEGHDAQSMVVQVRDFSSGVGLQLARQVARSARLLPGIAGKERSIAQELSNQVGPIREFRDHADKRAEQEAGLYHRSRIFFGPDFEEEAPLPKFLEQNNCVEVHLLRSHANEPLQAEKALLGVYFNYLKKLRKLGIANPEQALSKAGVRFAVSGENASVGALHSLQGEKEWEFYRPALEDVGTSLFFYAGRIEIVPGFHARAVALSVAEIQALIREHPELAQSVRGRRQFALGRTHYEHYLSEPELYAP